MNYYKKLVRDFGKLYYYTKPETISKGSFPQRTNFAKSLFYLLLFLNPSIKNKMPIKSKGTATGKLTHQASLVTVVIKK